MWILHLWRHISSQSFRYGNISDFTFSHQGYSISICARYAQYEKISIMASEVSGIEATHNKALENAGCVLNLLQLSDCFNLLLGSDYKNATPWPWSYVQTSHALTFSCSQGLGMLGPENSVFQTPSWLVWGNGNTSWSGQNVPSPAHACLSSIVSAPP